MCQTIPCTQWPFHTSTDTAPAHKTFSVNFRQSSPKHNTSINHIS